MSKEAIFSAAAFGQPSSSRSSFIPTLTVRVGN